MSMNRRRYLVVGLVAALLPLHEVLAEFSLATTPLPPHSRLLLVGEQLVHNGSAVAIARFRSDLDVEGVLGFYRDRWQSTDERPGYVEDEIEQWRVISRFEEGSNLVLQLTPDERGGSAGLLSILDVDGAGRPVAGIDLPPGSEVLSTTESRDGVRNASTWMIRSHARPGEVAGFYADHFRRSGWHVVRDGSRDTPAVVLMSSPAGTVEITAASDTDGTFVVVNRVRSGS